jgi:hypothetical protein
MATAAHKSNGKAHTMPAVPAGIRFGKPRPLLPAGRYHAVCTNADWDWTQRYKRNQAKFVFDQPIDYDGPMYPGDLVALYPLAGTEGHAYASTGSKFYKLWCETNGSTPTLPELSKAALKQMFEGRVFEIDVETVKRSWKAKKDEQDLPESLWYSLVREFRLSSLSHKQPVQPSQPANQDNQGNHPNPPNLLTLKPLEPCNQVTSKPSRFPETGGNGCSGSHGCTEVSGETHAGSTIPGGTEKPTSNSVPRSQELSACLKCGSHALYREKDGTVTCQSCSPEPSEAN